MCLCWAKQPQLLSFEGDPVSSEVQGHGMNEARNPYGWNIRISMEGW